jgi:hypothetical protein
MGNLHIFFLTLPVALLTARGDDDDPPFDQDCARLEVCSLRLGGLSPGDLRGPGGSGRGLHPGVLAIGFADGLLSLLKLIASPLADFTLVDSATGRWTYKVGYGVGVLTFAAAAGAAGAPAEAEASHAQWE